MKQKCINVVLDLDNTLICSKYQKSKRKPDFEMTVGDEHFFVYKRPGLDRFIMDLFDNAKSVSVWTAATKDYCNKIVKNIFTHDEIKKLKFIWSRGKTSSRNGKIYLKDMSKVFASYKALKPYNTLLIDDNTDHMTISADNILPIKAWSGNIKDCELSKISKMLKQCSSYGSTKSRY